MPKYQVELQNGKKYVVEADSMPTEDEVAAELQKNPEHMNELSTPTDVFHKSAGENILGVVHGVGEGVSNFVKGVVNTPANLMEQMRGKLQRGESPLGLPVDVAKDMATSMVTAPKTLGEDLGTGTPEALGRSLVNIPAYIGSVLGAKRLAGAGAGEVAQTGPVRAVRSNVADVLRSASETSPDLNAAASATGMRGKLGMTQKVLGVVAKKIDPGPLRSVDRYMPNTSPAPSEPVPNADVVPSQDAAVQAMVDRYMPNTSAEPSMAVSHTPEPPAQTLQHNSQSIQDILHPGAQDIMQRMYDEAVRMNGGKPSTASSGTVRVPPGAEINPAELRPRTLEEAYRMIGQEPYPPTAAPAPEPAPASAPAPAPRRATGRGLTAAAMERAVNQATPGWHEVLLNEPTAMPSHAPEPPMPLKRPSNVSPVEQIAGTVKEEYDRLAGKAIRTPDEQMRFQQLGHIMKATGASNKGYAYATQGK